MAWFERPHEMSTMQRDLLSLTSALPSIPLVVIVLLMVLLGGSVWSLMRLGHQLAQAYAAVDHQGKAHQALAEQLAAAQRTADQARHMQRRLWGMLAHELRTPLTAILGFDHLLAQDGSWSAWQQLVVERINANGTTMLHMIDDMVDLASIEAGELTLTPMLVDMKSVVTMARTTLTALASQKGVQIDVVIGAAPLLVWADPCRLHQIVLTMLTHAITTTLQGVVTLSTTAVEGSIHIIVQDTAMGRAPVHEQDILGPSAQSQDAMAAEDMGYGIGLLLTQSLLRLHGGTLIVQSRQDGGTMVLATLPAARGSDDGCVGDIRPTTVPLPSRS